MCVGSQPAAAPELPIAPLPPPDAHSAQGDLLRHCLLPRVQLSGLIFPPKLFKVDIQCFFWFLNFFLFLVLLLKH